jgi:hypothetical protein
VASEIGAAAISMHLSFDQSRRRTVGSWIRALTMVGTANRYAMASSSMIATTRAGSNRSTITLQPPQTHIGTKR